jgi:hypothetical protein
MTDMLWCLEGASAATLGQLTRLEHGLRLHIEHTALTTTLMQIGSQQQAYISAAGCEGCAYKRCVPGCYVELLRRLLRACFDACTLRYVPGGLAKRPYQRAAIAWPTPKAEPLVDMPLALWPEARLTIQWRGRRRQIAAAALLAVGAEGPDPAPALRTEGWQTCTLPKALLPAFVQSAPLAAIPFPRHWPHAPALLWQQPAELVPREADPPTQGAPLETGEVYDPGTLVSHPTAPDSVATEGSDTFSSTLSS